MPCSGGAQPACDSGAAQVRVRCGVSATLPRDAETAASSSARPFGQFRDLWSLALIAGAFLPAMRAQALSAALIFFSTAQRHDVHLSCAVGTMSEASVSPVEAALILVRVPGGETVLGRESWRADERRSGGPSTVASFRARVAATPQRLGAGPLWRCSANPTSASLGRVHLVPAGA